MTISHDYHMHTHYSPDSNAEMSAMVARAVELGVAEIMFTEHQEYDPAEECTLRAEPWFAEIERANALWGGRLRVRAGLEVGQPHLYRAQYEAEYLARYTFDSVSGSLHRIGAESVFDNRFFAKRTADQAYSDYFTELLRMAEAGGFDILTHMDVHKRYGFRHYGRYDLTRCAEPVRAVLRALIANEIALEINTAGLRYPCAEQHPDAIVLTWYRELGGELLTLGSDAHRPEQIALGFDAMRDIARAAGFTRLTQFVQRRKQWVPL